jgi:DtxR family Mn-dependent transcriptional regulator
MSGEHATPAEEEYLQIIYWLMEAQLPITGANIARAMRLAPPVHEMVGRLEHDGYVTRAEDKSLRFTDNGLEQAEAIVGRHRLIERFLTDVVGIAWDDVHEEAEKLEHAMSPAFEKWMISSVGDAQTCPHGHPIEPGKRVPGVPLADVAVGADVEILRFENEAEDILHYLKRAGLHPGLTGKLAESGDDEVVVKSNGSSVSVTRSVAETVSVKADPSPPPRTALPDQLVLGKDRYGR